MSKYDSILKEKKKYQELELVELKKKKRFPYLLLDIIFIMLILIISYYIYYSKVLAPDKIFMSDISRVIDDYKSILKYLSVEEVASSYYYEGVITLDNQEYKYGIIRDQDRMKIDFSIDDNHLNYYSDLQNKYINLSNFGEDYIKLGDNLLNNPLNKDNFSNYVGEDKYIKKFYFDGYVPVVEANLVLSNEDIRKLFINSNLEDEVEVMFTFKNNAFTNEIINMKITVNNVTNGNRNLITYSDGAITYSDGEYLKLKFILNRSNDDFNLKIYKNDILHSVLTGSRSEDSYRYMYQIIDKIYNISLNVIENEDSYVYEIKTNIEENNEIITDNILVTLNSRDNVILEKLNLAAVKNYNQFTKEEKGAYKEALNSIIGKLRKLIDKYQQGI